MSNEVKDYGEIFCQAVDNIVKERLSGIHFDQTIVGTIVDDKDKAQGKYTISYNQTKFEAYSSTTNYTKNTEVYVQIPSGDWNEQKIIVAKKAKDDKATIDYVNPFDSYVNITGNLITSTDNVKASLIANGDRSNIIIWSYNVEDKYDTKVVDFGEILSSYSRLGIQGEFRSWLREFDVVSGSYGLKLRVQTAREDANEEGNNNAEASDDIYYEFTLDAKDMIGDAYGFDSYFQQEKLFDISDLNNIKKMELSFYQNSDFKNHDGELLNAENIADNNLFVRDIIISLGYEAEEYEDDIVQIYCLESPKYSPTTFPPELNHREIQLRWVHRLDNGQLVSIDEPRFVNYTINWYKYKLGAYAYNAQVGADWVPLSEQVVKNGNVKTTIIDQDWYLYNAQAEVGLYREPAFNTTWLLPNITHNQEKIKAIITYGKDSNNQYIQSNVLTFSNRTEVSSLPTIDAMSALSIGCEDNSYGNYYLYGQGNEMLDTSQAAIEREFKLYFKGAELKSAEKVTWIIPTSNTMIGLNSNYYGSDYDTNTNPGCITINRYGDKHNSDRAYDIDNNAANIQKYKINSYYSPANDNNTIQCIVEKDGITYTATKKLYFGTSGTSGSEYTLVLQFDEDVVGIPRVGKDENGKLIDFDTSIVKSNGYGVTAYLYDYNNKLVEDNDAEAIITWSWYNQPGLCTDDNGPLVITQAENSSYFNRIIQYKTINGERDPSSIDLNKLYILQAHLEWGGHNLTAYLPIPLYEYQSHIVNDGGSFQNTQPAYITGTTNVFYNPNGYPSYYKGEYKMHFASYSREGEVINFEEPDQKSLSWEILNTTTNEQGALIQSNYNPELEITYQNKDTANEQRSYKLKPIPIYVSGANAYGIQCFKDGNLIWTQPILVTHNRYPNSAINEWDGKTLTLDEDEGYILSTAIAAGSKNSENQFTGVMIGDWAKSASVDESIKKTGIYGFHNGAISFSFTEDGKAVIGKTGRGRIEFDGSKGEIKSSSWNTDKIGMYLDLDNGILQMNNDGYITLSADESETPLSIGSNEAINQRPFRVEWDGTLHATQANIQGNITSSSIKTSEMYGDSSTNYLNLYGYLQVYDPTTKTQGGTLGFLTSNFGDSKDKIENIDNNTDNTSVAAGIGLSYQSSPGEYSYIKATNRNVGMSHAQYYLSLQGDENTPYKAVLRGRAARLVLQDDRDEQAPENKDARAAIGYGTNYLALYDNSIALENQDLNLSIKLKKGEWMDDTIIRNKNAIIIAADYIQFKTDADKQYGIYARFA